jgi:acyl-ACP thioesterase
MRYSFEGKIRYSEVGEDGRLTMPGILNYFQDCSTFQSESLHQGTGVLKERNRVWVLSAWQVDVLRFPVLGEPVVVSTWPYAFKSFLGYRNFMISTADGEMLARANSIWSYLDVERGCPVRLTEEDMNGYETSEKLDMDYAPRKIAIPAESEPKVPFSVQYHHLDTNHHVNNVQYICMASDCLPQGFAVQSMRAEYKKQVRLGEVLYPYVAETPDMVTVVLKNAEKQPCTVVQFSGCHVNL